MNGITKIKSVSGYTGIAAAIRFGDRQECVIIAGDMLTLHEAFNRVIRKKGVKMDEATCRKALLITPEAIGL